MPVSPAVAVLDYHPESGDIAVLLTLLLLEGVLSFDNAAIIAALARRLPLELRRKALLYGIGGAYVFRIGAILGVSVILDNIWLKVLGGAYLMYLAVRHLVSHSHQHNNFQVGFLAKLKIPPLWQVVITIELADIAFALDQVLVAVALTDKVPLIILASLVAILMLRLAAVYIGRLMDWFPRLEQLAYAAVGFVGIKLIINGGAEILGYDLEIPKEVTVAVTLTLLVVPVVVKLFYDRYLRPREGRLYGGSVSAPPMPVTAVVGTQWGDEGKGKVVDVLADRAKYVVRYQGGNNAGHTIVVGDETFKLHLLPSGVVSGKTAVIGNGCVVDPFVLVKELDGLKARGLAVDLRISDRAHLILPYHVAQDLAEEEAKGNSKVGTTGRGIGPCYADKAARTGIVAGDLLHRARLHGRLEQSVRQKQALLKALGSKTVLDAEKIEAELVEVAERLGSHITDTGKLLADAVDAEEPILLEGAQGAMLDLDHGTYPFVTSSTTTGGGMFAGTGLSPRALGDVVGVVKAYTTRVGEGPMPTELNLDTGAGKQLSEKGHEFGTTTGRKRRCGWLDLVVVRHACRLAGVTQLAVTKMDVLSGIGPVQVCVAYELEDGETIDHVPSDPDVFAAAKPVYQTFAGWDELGDGTWAGLPTEARAFLQFLREKTGATVRLVGIGPKREETVHRT